MEYKLKPLDIVVGSVEEIKIPEVNDRVIEKRGHVITFTLNQVLDNVRSLQKTIKEIEAKKELENAKMVNIEGFHEFVKTLSDQDLHTAFMYQQSKVLVQMCDEKLKEIKAQIESDEKEVEEMRSQIPELVSPVVQEAINIINEK